jgi:hypothetical protein
MFSSNTGAAGGSSSGASGPDYDASAVISSQGTAKKKRPGLSEGLVPSKKAMKFFDKVYDKK